MIRVADPRNKKQGEATLGLHAREERGRKRTADRRVDPFDPPTPLALLCARISTEKPRIAPQWLHRGAFKSSRRYWNPSDEKSTGGTKGGTSVAQSRGLFFPGAFALPVIRVAG